jgi:hypothetical protein
LHVVGMDYPEHILPDYFLDAKTEIRVTL